MTRKYDKRCKSRQSFNPWENIKNTRIVLYHKIIAEYNKRQADETIERKYLTESEWWVLVQKYLKYDRVLFYECVDNLVSNRFVIKSEIKGKIYYFPHDRKVLISNQRSLESVDAETTVIENNRTKVTFGPKKKQEQEKQKKDGEYHYDGINDIPDLR